METKNRYATTSTRPTLAAEVELLVGDEVFGLLSDAGFLKDWEALYRACPWATVFQSPAFVATWYQVYQQEYLPVLVRAGAAGHLTGLLALAVPFADAGTATIGTRGRMVGAGQYEAEYQAWLAAASDGTFIQAALAVVGQRFPRHHLQLRFLPPDTPLDWLRDSPGERGRCVLQPYNRPLMEMNDPAFPKLFHKTEYRNKLNRLKRLGEPHLELVTDGGHFAAILAELTAQYDFRQGALFNKNQFRDNPRKAALLLALFERHLLHVTVLKVDAEMLAAIVAVKGPAWVHLGGINIHNPRFADYSPGFVHFLLLGQQLAREGVPVFDLTPGEDAYKERFATRHDQVYELTVAATAAYRLKRQLRMQLHHRLIRAGIRPMTVELQVKKMRYFFRARLRGLMTPGGVASLLNQVKRLWVSPTPLLYVRPAGPEGLPAAFLPQKDSPGDLLDFEPQKGGITRWTFLGEAMRRFEAGNRSYTWSEGGRLLACAWVGGPPSAGSPDLPMAALPAGAALLQGFYCHPAGRDRWPAFLQAVAGAAALDRRQDEVYALAPGGDALLGRALVAAGFQMAPPG